jgi:hypothetical protein
MRLRQLHLHRRHDEGAAAWQPGFLQRGLRLAGLHTRNLPVRTRFLRRHLIAELVLAQWVPANVLCHR